MVQSQSAPSLHAKRSPGPSPNARKQAAKRSPGPLRIDERPPRPTSNPQGKNSTGALGPWAEDAQDNSNLSASHSAPSLSRPQSKNKKGGSKGKRASPAKNAPKGKGVQSRAPKPVKKKAFSPIDLPVDDSDDDSDFDFDMFDSARSEAPEPFMDLPKMNRKPVSAT